MEDENTYQPNGISEVFKFVKSDFTTEDWQKLIEFYTQEQQNG